MLGLNRYYMKILSFLLALVVGFNVENVGSEKFVASELMKVDCQLSSVDIKSVLVLGVLVERRILVIFCF